MKSVNIYLPYPISYIMDTIKNINVTNYASAISSIIEKNNNSHIENPITLNEILTSNNLWAGYFIDEVLCGAIGYSDTEIEDKYKDIKKEHAKNKFYIGKPIIQPFCKNQGIETLLIKHCLKTCLQKEMNAFTILDHKEDNLLKHYNHAGFQIIKKIKDKNILVHIQKIIPQKT